MINKPNNVLIFVAHQDDETIGSGGLIKYLSENNSIVNVVVISNGDTGINQESDENKNSIIKLRNKEVKEVKNILGFNELIFLDVPCQNIHQDDQILFHKIIKIIRKYKPDIVITHSPDDKHKDHRNTSNLVVDACWKSSENIHIELGQIHKVKDVWGMEVVDINDRVDFVIDISRYYDSKIAAIKVYESQNTIIGGIENFIKGMALVRGYQIGVKYGEGYKRLSSIPISI